MSSPLSPDPELQCLLQLLKGLAAEQDRVDAQEEQTERLYRRATSVSLALLGFSAFVLALEVAISQKVFWTYVVVAIAMLYFAGATVWLWRRSGKLLSALAHPKAAMLGNLEARLVSDQIHLDQLVTFDRSLLERVRDQLEQEVTTRLTLTEIVFGLVNRVGLIPGVLPVMTALVTAAKGAAAGALLGLEALTILFLIAYNVSTSIQIAAVEVRSLVSLLAKAINRQVT